MQRCAFSARALDQVGLPGGTSECGANDRTKGDVAHSEVREALLAPMAAPALPDAARSSSCVKEEEEEEFRSYECIEF